MQFNDFYFEISNLMKIYFTVSGLYFVPPPSFFEYFLSVISKEIVDLYAPYKYLFATFNLLDHGLHVESFIYMFNC